MSALRRSLQNVEYETSVRRRKSKRPRGKRRNTIAGTDQKELEAVIGYTITGFKNFTRNFEPL